MFITALMFVIHIERIITHEKSFVDMHSGKISGKILVHIAKQDDR